MNMFHRKRLYFIINEDGIPLLQTLQLNIAIKVTFNEQHKCIKTIMAKHRKILLNRAVYILHNRNLDTYTKNYYKT